MLIDYMLMMGNYLLFRDFVLMVENENNDDNDSMMFVMEMYEVYVDVEKTDRVYVVVVAVDDELVVGIDEYDVVVDDEEKTIEHAVVVVVDNEMQLYVDEVIKLMAAVVYDVDDNDDQYYLFVLNDILVLNICPDHSIVEYYQYRIQINQYYLVDSVDEVLIQVDNDIVQYQLLVWMMMMMMMMFDRWLNA